MNATKGFYFSFVILGLLSCLQGCIFLKVKEDIQKYESYTMVTGTVSHGSRAKKPILIVAYNFESEGSELADFMINYKPGPYEIRLAPGRYYIGAFEDANEDLDFQEDEAVGWYGAPTPIEVFQGQTCSGIDIRLRSPEVAKMELPEIYEMSQSNDMTGQWGDWVGEIVDLADPRFSRENGWLGFWEPVKFLEEIGGGVYFLAPFDPEKIPILFVHGVCNHPGRWAYIVGRLDRSRYQPWFFYYPTGLGLTDLAKFLAHTLCYTQYRYKYKNIYIVAHSVGGLITRGAINHLDELDCPHHVRLFISLSTPWQGHADARRGVEYAPVVVPCLHDLAPESPFLVSLHEESLPEQLSYYLLFSHRSGKSLFVRGNNDGVVTLKSQLSRPAQDEARKTIGFDEDHVTILTSEEVSGKINTILEDESLR